MYKDGNLLQKGIDVLFLLAREDAPLTIQDIGKSLAIPISTLYRVVQMLIRNELVERVSRDGHLALGTRNLLLARGVNEQNVLIKAAYPEMKQLHALTNEAIHLDVIAGANKLCIEAIESTAPLRVVSPKWRPSPLNAGASGKVLLAFSAETNQLKKLEDVGAFTKMTSTTVTDTDVLSRELQNIRKNGYAHTKSEVLDGAEGIAVPIFDWTKRIAASLALTAPTFRMKRKNTKEIIAVMKAAAEKISANLQS
jgi:DNA-binding IclR family transcriptional regulator